MRNSDPRICDGKVDCADGKDEDERTCGNYQDAGNSADYFNSDMTEGRESIYSISKQAKDLLLPKKTLFLVLTAPIETVVLEVSSNNSG